MTKYGANSKLRSKPMMMVTKEMLCGDGSQGNSSFAKDGMSFNSKQYDVKALAPQSELPESIEEELDMSQYENLSQDLVKKFVIESSPSKSPTKDRI